MPPGEYDFNGYGSFTDYDGVIKKITVAAGKPHKLPRLADDHALPASRPGDGYPAAPAELQQALIPQ